MPVVALVFIAFCIAAGTFDLISYRIPNYLVIAIAATFLVVTLFHLHEISWADQLFAGGACLVLGFALSFFGILGAGDAKLIAALALWSGVYGLLPMMLFTSLAGLAVLLAVFLARWLWPRIREARNYSIDPRILRKGEGIPYGIAIAIGAITAMPFFPEWLW